MSKCKLLMEVKVPVKKETAKAQKEQKSSK